MKRLLQHPLTQHTRRFLRLTVVICAVLLSVSVVTTVTVDLGPAVRKLAEDQGSKFIRRPMHIGRLSIHLWRGKFRVENLVIEGLTPTGRPFLNARLITVSMPWSTLFTRRVVFDSIEMSDWTMYAEVLPGGKHNFPRFVPDGPKKKSAWTTTLQYVRAYRGEFTFEDHGVPWSTVARNIDIVVARPHTEYRGQARFTNGTVTIQKYLPMTAEMTSTFKMDGALLLFDRMDLITTGARSQVTGSADMGHFPEMTYQIKSHIQFPPMREIFFPNDTFDLHGEGEFTGTWHLFKGGRTLTGSFQTPMLGVNDYRFSDVRGSVLWVPDRLEVQNGTTRIYGGDGRFTYTMYPLGVPDTKAIYTLDAKYRNLDLTSITDFLQVKGLRLAGRVSGEHVLSWPSGGFSELRGRGSATAEAPASAPVLGSRMLPPDLVAAGERRADAPGPFSNHTPLEPVPLGGEVRYTYGPDWIQVEPGHVATPSTFIEFAGRTAWGKQSELPFHVASTDWQDSDRFLSGMLTAFGSPTNAIEIAGHGEFDGVMTESFARPRIEGDFVGEGMRAWRVNWGRVAGHAVIENAYADVKDVTISAGSSEISATGRFSLGYPRKDGGEQINARVRVTRRPVSDLRAAFALYDYRVDGELSGEFHVFGAYENPYGFGMMSIEHPVAYGEPLDLATASLRFEGQGVRLDGIEIRKGPARAAGAAYVGFNGDYSFNMDGRRLPLDALVATDFPQLPPVGGTLDFSAVGSGVFESPAYDVKATLSDVFIADEGVGRVTGDLAMRGDILTMRFEAASPRLAVSGAGRIDTTETYVSDITLQVNDTSLDPYIRAFRPALLPFTTAVASGRIHVTGDLADLDRLKVDVNVDRFDLSLFDYRIRNAAPIVIAVDGPNVRVTDMRLTGDDTQLDVMGVVNLNSRLVAARVGGTANLGIIQGFVRDVRGSGRASVAAVIDGPLDKPVVNGGLTIENGRLRHFAVPHAIENINGIVQLDARGIRLDGVTARLGGGDLAFGGRVDVDGFTAGRIGITMSGRNVRLRFPEGMRSLVDADLSLTGTAEGVTLGGDVLVRSALYSRRFDTGFVSLGGGGTTGAAAASSASLPIRYDIRITAPSTLRIENNTARITASADVQLRGTYDKPLLFGHAEVNRGQALFEGKRYVVTRGTIDFNNPVRIEPFFDVQAETRVRVPGQTYRVTVSAAGTMERLTPQFTSDPPLPEMQAIALLLGNISPGQDVELTQYSTNITPAQQLLRDRAAQAVTGALTAPVNRAVEQTLGVDTFQVTPTLGELYQQSSRLNPSARLTIGKRLSERIFLTFSRTLASATRDQIILLEYDQSDRYSWVLSQNEDDTYALEVRVRHVF